ncbi:hypothetical protein NXF25_018915 [Crotalus adamanteus]|uniref:Secreted protein n=1 Tax=Crotalus adamanteus TaxID=8729 RepID=A0AAW1B0B3_CROAD
MHHCCSRSAVLLTAAGLPPSSISPLLSGLHLHCTASAQLGHRAASQLGHWVASQLGHLSIGPPGHLIKRIFFQNFKNSRSFSKFPKFRFF